jgi:IS30 family transposase
MPDGQLTPDERYQITHLHQAGHKPAEIGRCLGRHRATIGRELARNADRRGGYHNSDAQQQHEHRRSSASPRCKLDPMPKGGPTPLGKYVRDKLKQRWSPEQIAGRLRKKHPRDVSMWISHETIYQWIYRRSLVGERWHEKLRRRRKRRKARIVGERSGKRGVIPGRVGIEKRPVAANERRRFGDWESDTVEGAKGTGLVVTHVERKSRCTRLAKLADKKAKTLSRATNTLMKDLPAMLRRTMTPDNGKEFADFKTMEQALGVKVYFANPHSPWERGLNENTNGLLRDWLPKGSSFRQVTDARLAQIQALLNNRPRKCLGYRTPLEVLNALPGVALQN